MAKIKAFKGYRPPNDLASEVAAVPYDVINKEEAIALATGNPNSFLHITRSEVDLPEVKNVYSQEVYDKARNNFLAFVEDEVLVQDSSNSIYLYRQIMEMHSQIGIVVCSHIDDYFDDVIKKHEYTRPKKEKDRIDNMLTSGLHAGPIFSTFKQVEEIEDWMNARIEELDPEVNFVADDGIIHSLWRVDEPTDVAELVRLFDLKVEATYIADGHHRAASSAKVGAQLREANNNHTGDEEYNWMLTVLFPHNQLSIIDYNRLVKDLNGLSEKDFFAALEKNFNVEKYEAAFKPKVPYQYGMYMNGSWYSLILKDEVKISEDAVESLDIAILSDLVLDTILGIKDQRTEDRSDFVGGIRGMRELEKRVDSGDWKLAFSIYPVSIDQLIDVADSGNVMPPKSTWFEPKLRSGLVLHRFL